MRPAARHLPFVVSVAGLGLLAGAEGWLEGRRPEPLARIAQGRLVVTSGADAGPGSLREAIFAADRAPARTRIELRTPRITLTSPLPPLVNPEGVVLEAGEAGCEIDARALEPGPVLDLAGPRCSVAGLRVRGALGAGVLVRASGAKLEGLVLADCAEGVVAADGAVDLTIEGSLFDGNGVGVRILPGASGVSLRQNRFRRHDQAAVWAVSPEPPLGAAETDLVVRDNRLETDRIGFVLIHRPALVESNELVGSVEAAIYLTGAGTLRGNRVRASGGFGVFADAPAGATIEGNELDHNFAGGILLRDARDTVVRRNRMYLNGYGIVVVFGGRAGAAVLADNLATSQREDGFLVLGASPLLQGNHALGNRGAGVRVLDYVPLGGPRRTAAPLLRDNVLRRNASDSPAHGEYRQPREKG